MVIYLNGKLCILRCVKNINSIFAWKRNSFFFKDHKLFLRSCKSVFLAVMPISACIVNVISCRKHKVSG